MNIYSKKTYLTPIADIVTIDEKDDLLGFNDMIILSKNQGGLDDEADAKPIGAVEFYNEIWDSEVVSETE